jgi:hypothetical protein
VGNKVSGKAPTKPGFTNGNTTPKSFSELDLEYKNELIAANKALMNGEITPKQYQQSILLLTKSRQVDLQNITQGLQTIVAQNPKAKIGKKEIASILNDYTNELGGVAAEYNGIRTGKLVLVMSSENHENPAGMKFSTPTLQFVDRKNIPKDSVDANGIYYPTREESLTFAERKAAEKYAKDHGGQVAQDPSGNFFVTGEDGNPVKKKYLDITDTEGNSVSYELDDKYGWLPQAVGPKTGALRKQLIKEADMAAEEGQDYKPKLMGYKDVFNYKEGTPVGITSPKPPKEPGFIEKAINPVVDAIKEVPDAVVTAPLPAAPKTDAAPAQSLGITPSTKINVPQPVGLTSVAPKPAQTAIKTASTNLSLAGTKPATTIPLPKGQKPAAIQAPPKINIPQAPKNINFTQSIQQSANSLINNAKKLLGFK